MVSNIVMAITVLVSLELLTRLLYFTPITILASIILSALPGLIDINEAFHIWKVDKMDFLACLGAFLGVLFASVEIGLVVAVCVYSYFNFLSPLRVLSRIQFPVYMIVTISTQIAVTDNFIIVYSW